MVEDLEKLREIVLREAILQRELQDISDSEKFVSRVVEIGREKNLQFGVEDVLEAMRENRRVWVERWI